MTFNSIRFLVFLAAVVPLFYALRHRFRWILLLGASIYFYMCWRPEYIVLLLASAVVDYWAGLRMGAQPEKEARKPYLYVSLVSNLGLLFAFKYLGFLNDSARTVAELIGSSWPIPHLDILLPVGISFYTFQTMSYSLDVYYGRQVPERHFGIFLLFVSYFPQLVAGPIERAGNLLHQLKARVAFDPHRMASGAKMMFWGLFKKVMIADRVAPMVDHVYNNPMDHSGPAYVLATVLFAVQIYCDFSGYSHIAIGVARMMGVELMQNFEGPYFARSISDFWRRWHISLSTWFRDYVYIPLGGNRTVKWRWYYNLFITFLLSGIWHGANWTFVIWGALHGFYLVFAIISERWRMRFNERIGLTRSPLLLAALQTLTTFALVCFGWIFFRANTVADAFTVIHGSFHGLSGFFGQDALGLYSSLLGTTTTEMLIATWAIIIMIAARWAQRHGGATVWIAHRPTWQRWAIYYALIGSMVFFGAYYQQVQFIYFQF